MSTSACATLCLGFLATVVVAQNTGDAFLSVADTLATYGPGSFAFNPSLLGASSNATQTSSGGFSQRRTSREWPALAGTGISQTYFEVVPCGFRSPHEHPYASGLLYAISADNLTVGFVTEEGKTVTNSIQTGASTVFPQGLIHWQQNMACTTAQYTISYNDEQGATINAVPALLAMPKATLMAALGINSSLYDAIISSTPKGNLYLGQLDCQTRCGILPATAG